MPPPSRAPPLALGWGRRIQRSTPTPPPRAGPTGRHPGRCQPRALQTSRRIRHDCLCRAAAFVQAHWPTSCRPQAADQHAQAREDDLRAQPVRSQGPTPARQHRRPQPTPCVGKIDSIKGGADPRMSEQDPGCRLLHAREFRRPAPHKSALLMIFTIRNILLLDQQLPMETKVCPINI
jgi:hypothetical protein